MIALRCLLLLAAAMLLEASQRRPSSRKAGTGPVKVSTRPAEKKERTSKLPVKAVSLKKPKNGMNTIPESSVVDFVPPQPLAAFQKVPLDRRLTTQLSKRRQTDGEILAEMMTAKPCHFRFAPDPKREDEYYFNPYLCGLNLQFSGNVTLNGEFYLKLPNKKQYFPATAKVYRGRVHEIVLRVQDESRRDLIAFTIKHVKRSPTDKGFLLLSHEVISKSLLERRPKRKPKALPPPPAPFANVKIDELPLRNSTKTHCFINSVLQSLYSLPKLRSYLLDYHGKNEILYEIADIFDGLDGEVESVDELRKLPGFEEMSHGQQDANEFLVTIFLAQDDPVISKMFEFKRITTPSCSACGAEGNRNETSENSVFLAITNPEARPDWKADKVEFQELIADLFMPTTYPRHCDACGEETGVLQVDYDMTNTRYLIINPGLFFNPDQMGIDLGEETNKDEMFIIKNAPELSGINVDGHVMFDQTWRLLAAVEHEGETQYQGHYFAHVRCRRSGLWLHMNDYDKPLRSEKIDTNFSSNYLLFFENLDYAARMRDIDEAEAREREEKEKTKEKKKADDAGSEDSYMEDIIAELSTEIAQPTSPSPQQSPPPVQSPRPASETSSRRESKRSTPIQQKRKESKRSSAGSARGAKSMKKKGGPAPAA